MGNNSIVENSKNHSVTFFIHCEREHTLLKVQDWYNNGKTRLGFSLNKVVFILENCVTAGYEVASPFEICKREPDQALAEVYNRLAMKATSDVLLFVEDRVLDGELDPLAMVAAGIQEGGFDALSPRIYVWQYQQNIYGGESFSTGLFSGFIKMIYPGEIVREEQDLPVEAQTIERAQALSEDCLGVRRDVFLSLDGFSTEFSCYPVFELSCRLEKNGHKKGWMPGTVLKTERLYRDSEEDVSEEYITLLERYGDLFEKKEEEGRVCRGIYCPAGGIARDTGRGRLILCSHELSLTGAPMVTFEMAKQLRSLGFQVFFLSVSDGPLAEKVLEQGFPLLIDDALLWGRWRADGAVPQTPWLLDNIYKAFDKMEISCLDNHNMIPKYRNREIDIVWWAHESSATLEETSLCMPVNIGDNVRIYCGGKHVQAALEKYNLYPNTEILLYGVEDYYSAMVPAEKTENDGKVKFFLPGSYEWRKGQDVMIDAILSLPVRYQKKAEFYFAGGARDKAIASRVEDFCKGWPNANILPLMSREALLQLYFEMDVILSPSLDDPLPVVMTEGMMFYRTCICSTETGTAYYIQDGKNGYVCRAGDEKDLERCIMEIIDRPDILAEIAPESRKIYDEYFSLDVFSKRLEEIFGDNSQ